ncbi:MAG: DHHW family protein [Lachnospiraceae bacterium]
MLKSLMEDVREVTDLESLIQFPKQVEASLNDELLGKIQFIETYGSIQKLLGKQEFNNFAFFKDKDGHMYYGSTLQTTNEDLSLYAKRLRRLNEYVLSKGKKMIFVMAPYKVIEALPEEKKELPINDKTAVQDEFLTLLQQNNVKALDMRIPMKQSGEPYDKLFFKTDHHWTPLGGFYGTQALVREIEKQFGEDLDPEDYYLNLEQYEQKNFPQTMLGSMGKNTGYRYSGLDDFNILYPKFNTEFIYEDYANDQRRQGTFDQTLMLLEHLNDTNIYAGGPSQIYLENCQEHDKVTNLKNPDAPSFLVLRDSYFSTMAPFLAMVSSEIEMVWANTKQNPEMNYEKFIRENIDNYDYVIVEVYAQNIEDSSFAFFEE